VRPISGASCEAAWHTPLGFNFAAIAETTPGNVDALDMRGK
jgi:hypothetical protein